MYEKKIYFGGIFHGDSDLLDVVLITAILQILYIPTKPSNPWLWKFASLVII